MALIELRHGSLLVSVDPASGRIGFERAGKRLPWELDFGSFALVVRSGEAETTHRAQLGALAFRRLGPARAQWIGDVGGAGVALNVDLDAEGLAVTLSPTGTGAAEPVSAAWDRAVNFAASEREACWSDGAQGRLFRSDGKPWAQSLEWRHTAMRVFGFTADGASLAVIVETPFDAEAKLADDGARSMGASFAMRPSLGKLAYARRIRFVPLVGAGHVAVAGAFRAYARRHGMWKSFEERVDENPEVEKLRGAFVACAGYWWDEGADHVAAMKKMRAMGFEHGWLFSPKFFCFDPEWTQSLGVEANRVADARIAEIQALGYLCAPFMQVEEAGPSIGMDKFAVGPGGERILRWEIGERKFWEIAKWRLPGMLPVFDDALQECAGIHFDTLTAMRLVEHWGERAYDRAGDVRLRMDVADYYRRRGKVICSESMRDWGITRCDLSTSKTFAPVGTRDGRVWTAPLTDLVYHDSTVRSHWEHHSYDDNRGVRDLIHRAYHPFGMELTDLLTASPPVLFPEGTLYTYELKDVTGPDGVKDVEVDWTRAHVYRKRLSDPETQAALPKALRVCKLNARHGVSRMTSHRFLDPRSPMVQESEFASGLRVVVNFGDEPFTMSDGRTVQARGSIVEE